MKKNLILLQLIANPRKKVSFGKLTLVEQSQGYSPTGGLRIPKAIKILSIRIAASSTVLFGPPGSPPVDHES